MNNKTQAVRLPKDVAFPDDVTEVEITVVGESRLITPKGKSVEHWLKYGKRSPNFPDRDQPPVQEREWWD